MWWYSDNVRIRAYVVPTPLYYLWPLEKENYAFIVGNIAIMDIYVLHLYTASISLLEVIVFD